jgi:glycosyltransferase involved in cell wall biosynthesis
MSRPHVLYVTPIFGYPPFGGPRLRTYNTLRALARVADVTLYLTDQPDTTDRDAARRHVLSFCRDAVFPEPEPAPTLAQRVAARLKLWRPPMRSERDPQVIHRLLTCIETTRPDLLWLGFGGISYDLVPLKEATRTPLVIETECVWSRFILRELPFTTDAKREDEIREQGRKKEEEERLGARHADLTTAVSEVDAAYFRSIAPDPERVMLINNVIDVAAYQDGDAASLEQPALLFAGTLSQGTANVDAGLWLLDEVMPMVWRERPDAHVYLVGRSPAPAIVARRGRRVHVTGEVPVIVPYMRASTAALVPLRWESGTRFKILEAFACKTPVVSTSLGAEGLAVEHGRHLLLADDAAAFAMSILTLLDDPAAGRRLTGPAFELVEREYDISSAERQIEAVLARLRLLSGVEV